MPEVIQPRTWPRPRGYVNGMVAGGRILAIAGQVGGRPPSMQIPPGLPAQFAQAVDNVLAVVKAAGGRAADVISLTIYVTDLPQYQAATSDLGQAWRARFGDHYPAMALIEVKGLIDPEALVEIQGLAVLP